jgi:cytochrome b561
MPDRTGPAYTLTARSLHWLTAVLVLIMVPIGFVMANADMGPAGDRLYDLHRSIGAVLLPIMLMRVIYRWFNPPPPLPSDIPPVQQLAAHFTHWALYLLLIIQSGLGWVATSAYRAPIIVFGLFELPPIWPIDQPFSERAFALHRFIGIALGVLVCMHIGAALYHHFVRQDRVLLRMVNG